MDHGCHESKGVAIANSRQTRGGVRSTCRSAWPGPSRQPLHRPPAASQRWRNGVRDPAAANPRRDRRSQFGNQRTQPRKTSHTQVRLSTYYLSRAPTLHSTSNSAQLVVNLWNDVTVENLMCGAPGGHDPSPPGACGKTVMVVNPDRRICDDGPTKVDLVTYYMKVAPRLLPFGTCQQE
jgi:hypothetical protein